MSQLSNPLLHWWREIKANESARLWPHIVQGDTTTLQPNISPYGRQQPLGWQWHTRKHQGGGMPCPDSMGPAPRTFFLPLPPLTSGFWVMRQAKTLALVWALQPCTWASGTETVFLHDAARELQQSMAPLMTFKGDDIVEATLLRPTEEESRTSPTPEQEANLPGEEEEPA